MWHGPTFRIAGEESEPAAISGGMASLHTNLFTRPHGSAADVPVILDNVRQRVGAVGDVKWGNLCDSCSTWRALWLSPNCLGKRTLPLEGRLLGVERSDRRRGRNRRL